MSDPRDTRDLLPEETAPKNTDPTLSRRGVRADGEPETVEGVARASARAGDVRPNPHTDRETPKTAARTGGLAIGIFFPAVIVFVVALIVIAYFLLT